MKSKRALFAILLLVGSAAFVLGTVSEGKFQWMKRQNDASTVFEMNSLRANVEMLRQAQELRDGMGMPFIHRMSNDGQHIVIRFLVFPSDMPKDFDERKKVMQTRAAMAIADAASEFGVKDYETEMKDFQVEFLGFDPKAVKFVPYADYVNGKLTFQ